MSVKINTGSTFVRNIPQWIDLATTGAVTDSGALRKFGEAVGVGTTEQDLWNAPVLTETLMTSGQTLVATSEDDTNGVGQTLRINGLDENWEEQEGLVTLNGQTAATITQLDGSAALWTRLHRAYQISAEPDPVGDVWISEADTYTLGVPDTSTKVHGFIDYTNAAQQTEKGMFTIPVGYTGIILGITAGMRQSGAGASRSAEVFIEVQELSLGATVGSPQWAPFRRISEISLYSAGQVWVQEFFTIPQVVPQLTNVHLRTTATASSDITGAMYITLVPNDYLGA